MSRPQRVRGEAVFQSFKLDRQRRRCRLGVIRLPVRRRSGQARHSRGCRGVDSRRFRFRSGKSQIHAT